MVTRASDVKPQITVCTYTCDMCGSEIFQDVLGPQYMPLQKCPSQRCTDNKTSGRIQMQTRGSRFVKYQELRLQELPDQVPVGHIPRSLTIHCRYLEYPFYFYLPFPLLNPRAVIPFFLVCNCLHFLIVCICRGEQTRQCGPGDIITVAGMFLTVRRFSFFLLLSYFKFAHTVF